MNILTILIIAISLSMDAFSLALAYGTLDISKNRILVLSIVVGVYHFFMPLIGKNIGSLIMNFLPIKPDLIVFVVLGFIGIQMIIESFKDKEQENIINIFQILLFGFAVSIDSFSVGIGLNSITDNHFLSYIVFSICSFIFTFLGLVLGKKINHVIGKISTIIGGIVLIIIGLIYLVRV